MARTSPYSWIANVGGTSCYEPAGVPVAGYPGLLAPARPSDRSGRRGTLLPRRRIAGNDPPAFPHGARAVALQGHRLLPGKPGRGGRLLPAAGRRDRPPTGERSQWTERRLAAPAP